MRFARENTLNKESVVARTPKTILQINARVWLNELRSGTGANSLTLGRVEESVVANWRATGYDFVWLMGVWKPSRKGEEIARSQDGLLKQGKEILHKFKSEDIVASPFAVPEYSLNPVLGGDEDLTRFCEMLHRNELRLALDFVPNHTALDHRWVKEHPEYYIQGTPSDPRKDPGSWFPAHSGKSKAILAHGRDPNFPAWTDTAQLNVMHRGARKALIDQLVRLTSICDGVRCDMAGLLLNSMFRRNWESSAPGSLPGKDPEEFWSEAIAAAKKKRPDFLFIGEGYGDETVARLVSLGFDQVYDKKLLDELLGGVGQDAVLSIASRGDHAFRLLHFTENHDERRAADAFGPTRSMAAALVASTLPGMVLFQEGQEEGWRVRLPVQLRRRPAEKPNRRLERFYSRLLTALRSEAFRSGQFIPLSLHPVEEHLAVAPGLIAYLREKGPHRRIVIANSGRGRGRAYAPLPPHWTQSGAPTFRVVDELSGATEEIPTGEVRSKGFLIDLSMGGHRLWKVVVED